MGQWPDRHLHKCLEWNLNSCGTSYPHSQYQLWLGNMPYFQGNKTDLNKKIKTLENIGVTVNCQFNKIDQSHKASLCCWNSCGLLPPFPVPQNPLPQGSVQTETSPSGLGSPCSSHPVAGKGSGVSYSGTSSCYLLVYPEYLEHPVEPGLPRSPTVDGQCSQWNQPGEKEDHISVTAWALESQAPCLGFYLKREGDPRGPIVRDLFIWLLAIW